MDIGATQSRHTPAELSLRTHRCVIGVLGALLPVLVYLVAGIRPTPGLDAWEPLPSVSAYYYTGAGGLFVGIMVALAVFLFNYQGYKEDKADRVLGRVSAAAAFAVAFWPTRAPDPVPPLSWWQDGMGVLHHVGATVLFASFILFSVWLFRKSEHVERKDRPPSKRRRDDICLICGIVMIGAVACAALFGAVGRPIVYPEAVAIVAFGISWLTKASAPVEHVAHVRLPLATAIRADAASAQQVPLAKQT